uniref:Reverse transcriptase domain-containing protein n=1 Tax=Lactuca sativa TaxID=4236 RepID=A0A9R1VR22_LACSA|nr:hypothetical protein LSAT_V11C400205890 [Lactuca sativa]
MAHINAITTNEQIFNPMTPIQNEDPSVDKLVFLAHFILLDMEEDHKVPLILGRPFINIVCAIMDRLLDGIEGDEDISSSEGTNSACLDKQLQYGETNQDNKKESLEKQENTKA